MPEAPGLPAGAGAACSSPRSPGMWQKPGRGLVTDNGGGTDAEHAVCYGIYYSIIQKIA